MESIIKLLLEELKEQHGFRYEECSRMETEESFSMLKHRLSEKLVDGGCRDFELLKMIQEFK